MAKIGIKGLTYAPYTSGGDGSAIVYGTGVQLTDYMIRADINEERADVPFYADDHKIDSENEVTGISIGLELANMTDALEKAFLGHVDGSSGELNVTSASAPFVGVGFYRKERFKGTVSYHAFWIYKIQFSKDGDSTGTKGDSIEFQTESLTGQGMGVTLTSGGAVIFYSHSRVETEAAAVAYLKSKAGIS